MKDIVIIGAGIIGSFLAYDLSQYQLDIVLLEKNKDVGCGATKANSAIVHSGHDPKEGTLKAKLNVLGNRMYEDICKTFNCHYEKIGAYVLACGSEEEEILKTLALQAKHREIPFELHDYLTILQHEPNCSDKVTQGLYLPSTAIITPWEVAISLTENAMLRGCKVHLETEVVNIEKITDGYCVHTSSGKIETRCVINCAGIYADHIAKMINPESSISIQPRRGEYFVLDHTKEPVVHHILFPVPSNKGKGVLLVPTIHKNVLLGPTSDFIDEKDDVSTTKTGLDYVKSHVHQLVKDVPMHQVIRTFSGNRPVGNTKDFIIEEDSDFSCFFNVAAIESPGIASAPAISQYVIDELVSKRLCLQKKTILPDVLKRPCALSEMTYEKRQNIIKEDSRYGHIICRCETISEGEIIEAIHRPLPALTVGAIKRRLRPGMGRCQGGFCEPLIIQILAKELNINENEVTLEETGSNVLVSKR